MFVVEKRASNGGGNKIGFDEFMMINEAGMEVEIKERTKENMEVYNILLTV